MIMVLVLVNNNKPDKRCVYIHDLHVISRRFYYIYNILLFPGFVLNGLDKCFYIFKLVVNMQVSNIKL